MTRLDWSKARPKRPTVAWNDYEPYDQLSRAACVADKRWRNSKPSRRPFNNKELSADSPAQTCRDARRALSTAVHAVIYTDGSCAPNPGTGGFGAIIEAAGSRVEVFGGVPGTTNNRMELMGAIAALEVLPLQCSVTLVSDSRYLVNGANRLARARGPNRFFRSGKPIINVDLWRRLIALADTRLIQFQWVRGHSNCVANAHADALAAKGRRAAAAGCSISIAEVCA